MTKRAREFEKLLQQSVIVSNLLLDITRLFQGDYRGKHAGAVWEQWLVSCVLWSEDTVLNPMAANAVAKRLGIPPSNARRCIKQLLARGNLCKVKHRYARDVSYIEKRLTLRNFRDVRMAIIDAGDALREVYSVPHVRQKKTAARRPPLRS